jgi:hypothetical protein
MKELIVRDISVYSEDGDTWDDLIKVVKKANKAYLECIKDLEPVKKESWIKRLLKKYILF